MLKRRSFQIFLVTFFTTYFIAMVFVFSSPERPSFPNSQRSKESYNETNNVQQNEFEQESFGHWITHDAAGFFTPWLVFVGGIQLALFWIQLGYISDSLINSKEAAKAAKKAANIAKTSSKAAIAFERPYVRVSGIKPSIRGNVFLSRIRNDIFQTTNILREPYAMCTIENYGKTPAFIEATQAQLRFSPADLQIILTIGKPIPGCNP
jgi:hypothetical protein